MRPIFMEFNSHKTEFARAEFDVVIPAHPKDAKTLKFAIAAVKKNVIGFRRIIVVSKERISDDAEWFNEALYPFSFDEVKALLKVANVGWNYQQLLKFYAAFAIPNIAENVLILDADTVFYRKVKFFENGLPLYNLGKDKNLNSDRFFQNNLNHIRTILPAVAESLPEVFIHQNPDLLSKRLNFLTKQDESKASGLMSGICHHMIFQKSVLSKLFEAVQKADGSSEEFFKIFLSKGGAESVVSEYNLYFYFLVVFCQNQFRVRILKYKNTNKFYPLIEKLRRRYHYCSYHSYLFK